MVWIKHTAILAQDNEEVCYERKSGLHRRAIKFVASRYEKWEATLERQLSDCDHHILALCRQRRLIPECIRIISWDVLGLLMMAIYEFGMRMRDDRRYCSPLHTPRPLHEDLGETAQQNGA